LAAAYRGILGRKEFHKKIAEMTPATIVIQKRIRQYIAMHVTHACRMKRYWDVEFAMNGSIQYKNSLQAEIKHQIIHHTTHFKNPAHRAEMQCIFGHYCSMGTRGNIERLGVGMFIKFAKECEVITKTMSQQNLELLFTHEKGKDAFVHYPQFISILKQIANAKYVAKPGEERSDEPFEHP